jgi:hypothetical protein
MLAKVVKPATTCREANYSRYTINIRYDSCRSSTIGSWMSTAARLPESDTGKDSNSIEKPAIFGRDASNSSRNPQLEH